MSSAEPQRPQAAVLVFDIETVPDGPLLCEKAQAEGVISNDWEAQNVWSDVEKTNACLSALGYEFPPHIYHAVVSVCAVFVHPETYSIIDGIKLTVPPGLSYDGFLELERAHLAAFWSFATKHSSLHRVWYDRLQSEFRLNDFQRRKLKPVPVTFCGYNISGFDLPVIEQRSFRHLLACPIREYTLESGYESYRSRYAYEKTYDLMQYVGAMSSGAGSRVGLDALARAIGLGGKMQGMDGSLVAPTYFVDKDAKRIEEYCAVDVLITYGVLLGIQKFRGVIDEKTFAHAVHQFRQILLSDKQPRTYRELEAHSQRFFKWGEAPPGPVET